MHKRATTKYGRQGEKAPQAHPREPSPRNVEIFGRICELGQRQEDVARELGLSQSRVSRICSQVRAWREWTDRQRSQRTLEERRRFGRRLARRRNEYIYTMVMRGMARHGHDRQWLKLAMKISSTMRELDSELPPQEQFAASPAGQEIEGSLRQAAGGEIWNMPHIMPADSGNLAASTHGASESQAQERQEFEAIALRGFCKDAYEKKFYAE